MKTLVLAAAAAAALTSTGASAQSILTQNVIFGPQLADATNVTGVTTNGGVLPFFFFDSRVGTLNSITFASSYQFSSNGTVSNFSAASSTGTVATRSAARFSSDDALVTAALNRAVNTASTGGTTLSPAAYNLIGGTSAYSLSPGSSASFMSLGSGTTGFTDSNAADLAAFTRTGTFSYNPFISTATGVVLNNSGGNTTATQTTTFAGSLTISYNITPFATGVISAVPEPGSWAMMIVGLGIVGGALRRRGRVATGVAFAA